MRATQLPIVLGTALALGCAGDDGGDEGAAPTTGTTAPSTDDQAPDDGVDDAMPTTMAPTTSGSGSTGPVADDTSEDDSTGEGESSTGEPADPGPVVIYVTDGDNAVQAWSVGDETGTLTLLDSYDTGPGSSQLAVHPDGLHLYATARGGPMGDRVIAYEIAPADGALTELGVTQIEIGPVYWSIHPSGDFAFSATFGGDEIGVWGVADDFTIEDGAIDIVGSGDEPHAIVPHPDGQWVYVPHRTQNQILQYSVDGGTGMLTLEDTVDAAPGAGARHLAIHPNGAHAYLANEFSDSVSHFTVDGASGALTLMNTITTISDDFPGDNNTCADVHITPDGGAVYVSNRGEDTLAIYAVDSDTGALTSMGRVDTEARPREFGVDPTGRFVYSAGQDSGMLAGYTIDGGGLTAQGVVEIGGSPLWVEGVELPAR